MDKPQQMKLFDSPAFKLAAAGRALKLALSQAAKASNLSREEIAHRAAALAEAAGLNLCPGGRLGVSTLNKWLDVNSAGHLPSLNGLIALCEILGPANLLAPMLEALGLEIIGPEDQKYRDVGRAYFESKKARQGLKKAEEKLC